MPWAYDGVVCKVLALEVCTTSSGAHNISIRADRRVRLQCSIFRKLATAFALHLARDACCVTMVLEISHSSRFLTGIALNHRCVHHTLERFVGMLGVKDYTTRWAS